MAEYYTETSFILPICEGMEEKELKKWYEEMYKCRDLEDHNDNQETWYEQFEGYDFNWISSEGIWIHEESNTNIEAICWFIQQYLNKFDLEGEIYFSWANTCSKRRIDAFSGGFAIVTKNSAFVPTDDEILKAFGYSKNFLNT